MRLPVPLRRFFAAEDGSVTVEFVILFPMVMYIFFMGIEVAFWEAREILLRRATDLTIRDVRISTADPPTYEEMKAMICARAMFGTSCRDDLRIEMRALPLDQWTSVTDPARCIDRKEDVDPLATFQPGEENRLMLVRVCRLFQPILPGTGIGHRLAQEADGEFGIRVVSAYVTEPRG